MSEFNFNTQLKDNRYKILLQIKDKSKSKNKLKINNNKEMETEKVLVDDCQGNGKYRETKKYLLNS